DAPTELLVQFGAGDRVGIHRQHRVGERAIDREVVLAAEYVVIRARDARLGDVDVFTSGRLTHQQTVRQPVVIRKSGRASRRDTGVERSPPLRMTRGRRGTPERGGGRGTLRVV